jgi:hypothetical protein
MLKKPSKKEMEILAYKIDSDGFDYAICEYGDGLKKTCLEDLAKNYVAAKELLDAAIAKICVEYDIEYNS